MSWSRKSVDCELEEGVSRVWDGGGSQLIDDLRYNSAYCGLEAGVSRLWTGGGGHWILEWRRESMDCGV